MEWVTHMPRRWNEIAPLPVRLAFGGGFLLHGYPKVFTHDGYENILYIIQHVCIPTPSAPLMAYVVAFLEFFGGLALVTGTLVSLFSVLFIIEMIGRLALQVICGGPPDPLNPHQALPDVESALLYLTASIALLIGGCGGWSVTRMFLPKPSD